MSGFNIKPRRYYDKLDAINDLVTNALASGVVIDVGRNPNSKYALLQWAFEEITRLRAKAGELPPEKRTKVIVGPRPVAVSQKLRLEDFLSPDGTKMFTKPENEDEQT